MCILDHSGGLWGHCGLHMTLEVYYDLKFELTGLNNPCSSAYLAPKCFSELNFQERRKPNTIHWLARHQARSLVKLVIVLQRSIPSPLYMVPLPSYLCQLSCPKNATSFHFQEQKKVIYMQGLHQTALGQWLWSNLFWRRCSPQWYWRVKFSYEDQGVFNARVM